MGKYNRNYNNFNDDFAKDMEAPAEAETNEVAETTAEDPVLEVAPEAIVESKPVVTPEPKKEVKVEAPKKKSNGPTVVISKGPAKL
jgi:hypothetical protein